MKKKHKITLLVIGILLVLSLMLSSSYALWVFNVSQESTNVVQADCFEITFTDNNPINLEYSFPMRDSYGVQTTPYEFTIRNICNHPADFQINLETLNTSTIDESFIKADLNGHISEYSLAESVTPTLDNASSAVMLYEDTLAVNSSKTYNLRIWVKEDAVDEEVENKTYASKVSVKATVRKTYAEGTLISGTNFTTALKRLADGGAPNYFTTNTSIKSIEWSATAPTENDNTINVAHASTKTPIYVWFKDGTMYIYSELDKIYMNDFAYDMFYGMAGLTKLDLSHFDTSNVYNMENMFSNTKSLTSIDLSGFDTSNVTNMRGMFSEMSGLTNLDLSNFNTSKVLFMDEMFLGAKSLSTLDVSNFDTSKVTDMSKMFSGMTNLINLDVSNFDTSKVTNMSSMFSQMTSLTTLDLSNFDTSNVTNMGSMFSQMTSLTTLDLSNFDTSNVTNMGSMFSQMTSLTTLNLSKFDTSKVTSMYGMFSQMTSLTTLDLSKFDTSNVTNMKHMFGYMSNLISLNITGFDTSNVTDMSFMFWYTQSITTLDLSNFNTSNVTNMKNMFSKMTSLTELDLSGFDTSNVTDMSGMFARSTKLADLDILSFNTSNVTNMSGMFYECYGLEKLDLSSFNTSNVTKFYGYFSSEQGSILNAGMFEGSKNLKTIYISNLWSNSSVTDSNKMFNRDTELVGGAGTTYDSNHIDVEYARVDDPDNGKPGYFTLKTS